MSEVRNIADMSPDIGLSDSELVDLFRSISRIYSAIMNDDVGGTDKLYSSMQVCRWPLADIKGWKYMLTKRNSFKSFIKYFAPYFISRKIRF